MKRYDELQKSEVLWIGQYPREWTELRLKYFSIFRNGYSFKSTDFYENEKYPVIRIGDLQDGKINIKEAIRVSEEVYQETKRFKNKRGDILLALTGATIGKSAYYDTDEISLLNQRVAALRPTKNVAVDYLKYLIESSEFRTLIDYESYGGAQENIGKGQITSAKFPIPLREGQLQIVKYLDYKRRLIDRFIANRQKQIELLNQQIVAIINKAVTKGNDSNVKMKSSGLKWIGDIPEDWNVMDLKRIIDPKRPITYGIVQPGEEDINGRFMIRGQDYSQGWAKAATIFRVSDEVEVPYKRARVVEGDILITIVGAGCGNIAVVPDWLTGANLTQTTARLAIDKRFHVSEFFYYVLRSKIGMGNVDMYVKGAAQPGLNIGYIKVFKLTVPPKHIQNDVVQFIKKETNSIYELISKYQKQIELMQEYRTAIISQAVTGKIDVRDWKPKTSTQ